MGKLIIMLAKIGDQKFEWNSDNHDEVEIARKAYDEAIKRGFTAYSMSVLGKKGRKIDAFDPDAEKIILAPPVVGG